MSIDIMTLSLAKAYARKLAYPDGGGSGSDVPDASPTAKGVAKLYADLGANADGAITQKAATDAMKILQDGLGEGVDGVMQWASSTFIDAVPNATATTVGGSKMKWDGDDFYISLDGTDIE